MHQNLPQRLFAISATFFKLGLISFGGPVAHIAYFRQTFVAKKQWLSDEIFAQLLAICQFLPGPASSQLGFAIGLTHGGFLGAILAFISFTLPSVLLLLGFASLLPLFSEQFANLLLHSLKLVALVVVADAVFNMAKSLCKTWQTRAIALFSLLFTLNTAFAFQQVFTIVLAAMIGALLLHASKPATQLTYVVSYSKKIGVGLLLTFCALLAFSFSQPFAGIPQLAQLFYQVGALVFGGGHVVLPLLADATVQPQLLSEADFLAGYGAAQALPGPLFSVAAFLGSRIMDTQAVHWSGAITATIAIFLPGFLLLGGILPFWQHLVRFPRVQHALIGINAAVVGLLAATWYQPLLTSTILSISDGITAFVGLALLSMRRISVLWVICVILLTQLGQSLF